MRFVGEKSVAMRALVNVIQNFFLKFPKIYQNLEIVFKPGFISIFSDGDPFLVASQVPNFLHTLHHQTSCHRIVVCNA
jgi:hypothetical protein